MITKKFEANLSLLLNANGIDSLCNIPDYILAEHLCKYLDTLQKMNRSVDIWYGRNGLNKVTANVATENNPRRDVPPVSYETKTEG
tara:strand:- start:433 stop:690 length:258 start_codon:yes stop_codon:yes gene_type:complete